jgi:gliding motility-associated-like protein
LRDYILARCNTEIVTGIEDCYNVTAHTLTIQIDGLGEIEVESLDLNSTNTPYSGTYFADLPIDLFAASDGALCGNFVGWEVASGTATIADSQSDTTTISIESDVTLIAHFAEPSSGPIYITVETDLLNAGSATVNGNAFSPLPATDTFNPGEEIQISISSNEWFVFDHWESITAQINPNPTEESITITPCRTDTITAIFDYIDHYSIDIQPNVSDGGIILFNGDTLPSAGITLDLEASANYTLTALPTNQWSTFAYWELDGNSISPSTLSSTILLTLFENGSLTAVFNVIPHHEITVVVEPAEAGTVIFEEEYLTGEKYTTTGSLTVVLEGNKPLLFKATPNAFIDFSKWSENHHNPIGSAESNTVRYTFQQSDTVVAHFTQQPFTLFVPNGFSPNGDGINDVFKVSGNAIDFEEYEFSIFDRWGQVVFTSTSPEDAWTGEFNDGENYVGNSSYQYRLTVKSVFETNHREYSGSILLFR